MGEWQASDILDMAKHIAKQNSIWDSGIKVQHICGTFDHVVFKVILGQFGDLATFPKTQTSKCCLFYIYDSFQPNFLYVSRWPSTQKLFLGILKFKIKKKIMKNIEMWQWQMANRGARLSEIWESGVLVEHVERIWGISALIVIKVIWGSFGALVSKWPLTQKKKKCWL